MTAPRDPIITALRSSLGYYLCAESGGGREVVADRIEIGPWEQWTVTHNDDGTVSLQSFDGHYLTAEIDGTVAARATSSGEWERYVIEVRDDAIVAFKTHHGTYLQAPEGGGPKIRVVQVDGDPPRPGEWEFFASSANFWTTTPPPSGTPVVARPLIGPLRVEHRLFRDDTGYRRIHFCSWFPALRILRDNPTEFYRQLDSIVTHGYQGVRVFLAVGGWTDYWDGREVVPVTFTKWVFTGNHMRTDAYGETLQAWPDYDELLRELLQACVARKLRLHVTTGDMQIICPDPGDEIDLHNRFARICAEEGGLDVIGLVETTNEFPLNRYGSDGVESIEQMGRLLDVWTDTIPGLLVTAMGAIPQNEEPDSLYKASTYGNVCAVHVTRDPIGLCIKRTLGLVYWEGDYRAFEKPYWQGEPAGPGDDSYQRQDDPANLTALYAMMALTGQASNWFQGAGVRSDKPLESEWGFQELPAILDAWLPEDIATWDHGSNQAGGIEYWWKGNEFRTSVYEDWDPSPPRPIATWTLYTGTGVVQGKGTPQPTGTTFRTRKTYMAGTSAPARGTGLLVGTFA